VTVGIIEPKFVLIGVDSRIVFALVESAPRFNAATPRRYCDFL